MTLRSSAGSVKRLEVRGFDVRVSMRGMSTADTFVVRGDSGC